MKLKSYHNPENVDESRVPDGWRFLYADEAHLRPYPCMIWVPWTERFGLPVFFAIEPECSYIVPVNA